MGADTNPGVYPGNTSLPKEVREKILSTFRHALNLFHERKIDDCVIGCDFILKMDPRFSPARQLLDKARNPAAEIDVGELEMLVAGTPTRQEKVSAAEPDRLLVRAVESYNARDFPAAIASAEQVLAVLPGNQNAREILENARRKQSVQPQFDLARVRALAALEAGRGADARQELASMRGLDPDHPAVTLLERRIGGAPAAPAAASSFEQQFGASSSEPEIAFDQSHGGFGEDTMPRAQPAALDFGGPHAAGSPGLPGGGLETLSLDSLSLDLPEPGGPVVPPPPSSYSSNLGPLAGTMTPPPMPPPPIASHAPGSPQDLWSEDAAVSAEPMLDPLPAYSTAPPPPSAPEGPSPDEEVDVLLRQGDEAAGRGDRQQAIEIWSRIFLIDINNSDAVTRIERARQEMAEGNRRISEGLRGGRESFEKGDFAGAREKFLQVLAVDGIEPTARFYLERIEEELAKPPSPDAAPPPTPAGASADVLAGIGSPSSHAATSAAAAAPAPKLKLPRVSAKNLPPRTRLIAIAAAVVLVAGAAVYFFMLRSPAPSTGSAASAPGGPSLEDAMVLFREGNVKETAAALRRIPPAHPDYARAQKLLASLSGGAAAAPAEGGAAPLEGEGTESASAPQENEPARLRALAERALAEKRYIDALTNFNLAAPAYSADPEFARARASAIERVTELTPAVKLYNEAEYETAIPILWRIHSADRENQDARSYLFRAYYNQGIAQLQNGLYEKAGESFREAASLNTGDEEAARHQKFAQRYEKRDLDLMGRIYVRHVQPRP